MYGDVLEAGMGMAGQTQVRATGSGREQGGAGDSRSGSDRSEVGAYFVLAIMLFLFLWGGERSVIME